MKTVFLAFIFGSLVSVNTVSAADQAIVDKYNKTCVICHASGAAGAPITGNADQWAGRMTKGMDILVQNVDKGLNAMPPKGMCFDCTAEDFKALINYMVDPK